MGYYGMVVPALSGHVYPMNVLARALQQRGHRVVILSQLDAESKIRRAGVDFLPLAAAEFPLGAWERATSRMGELAGYQASLFVGKWLGRLTQGICRDLPQIARQEGFDGFVMDQVTIGTEGVCAVLRMPLAVACAALPLHAGGLETPPITTNWSYRLARGSESNGTPIAANCAGVRLALAR